jgi:hypothetical protein
MKSPASFLEQGRWGLTRARTLARKIEQDRRATKQLIQSLFSDSPELRKRAADVARRITEHDPTPLHPYADELAGLLAEIPLEESRTRWHLGLVVPRTAHTRDQRLRAAQLAQLLINEESNVVRCSAIEGIALLAIEEPSLRNIAEEMIANALVTGTLAMKSRARHAKKQLDKAATRNKRHQ